MSTTTIRLPEDLKARLAKAAARAGATAHNFILQAIVEKTELEERQASFHELADQRYARIVTSGETIPWQTLRTYLEARARGEQAFRPLAEKLGQRKPRG